VIGKDGIKKIIQLDLTENEKAGLIASSEVIRSFDVF
jgi:malate/lactate dehydrogenase